MTMSAKPVMKIATVAGEPGSVNPMPESTICPIAMMVPPVSIERCVPMSLSARYPPKMPVR